MLSPRVESNSGTTVPSSMGDLASTLLGVTGLVPEADGRVFTEFHAKEDRPCVSGLGQY